MGLSGHPSTHKLSIKRDSIHGIMGGWVLFFLVFFPRGGGGIN